MSDGLTGAPLILVEIVRQRDLLLHAAQDFVCAVDEEDFANMTIDQQNFLLALALHSGCTHLPWWGLPKRELKET